MTAIDEFTNRCACGWEVRGPEDVVVDATIEHGRRMHNMDASRDEVLAALRASDVDQAPDAGTAAG